jgi:hypothetical protein
MQGGRKLSSWNIFVKKIYQEGRAKNKEYSFKQALSDASRRKGEMGSSKPVAMGTKKMRKSRKGRSMKLASKKNRKHSLALALAGGKSRRRR